MDKKVFEANVDLESSLYNMGLEAFNSCTDTELLIKENKSHQLRFSLIIARNIALVKGDNSYADFLDFIINDMTKEISLLNKSMKDNSIDDVLSKFSFHEKVNIIFYVRNDFYDNEFEPYEILDEDTYNKLFNSIIEDANELLNQYSVTLDDVINKSINVSDIIKDRELSLDICFASELLLPKKFDLIFISGVSGVGKSTICKYIKNNKLLSNYEIFDIDDLENINDYDKDSYSLFYENSIKKAIDNANNKNVIIASCISSPDIKKIDIPRRIKYLYMILITCSDKELSKRLKERDKGRNCGSDEYIKQQLDYQKYLINNSEFIKLKVDNTSSEIKNVSNKIVDYILNN